MNEVQKYGLMNDADMQEVNNTFDADIDSSINVSSAGDNAGAAAGAAAGLAAL